MPCLFTVYILSTSKRLKTGLPVFAGHSFHLFLNVAKIIQRKSLHLHHTGICYALAELEFDTALLYITFLICVSKSKGNVVKKTEDAETLFSLSHIAQWVNPKITLYMHVRSSPVTSCVRMQMIMFVAGVFCIFMWRFPFQVHVCIFNLRVHIRKWKTDV